ncbi:hypothetical protein [Capnocytophaga canimorsus]|uniref:hypothetical protein n=1 Tax=Capnocytophaga canimorsus TaxID=28188 RepID=UPI00386550D6
MKTGVEIFLKTKGLTLWQRYKHRNTFALENEHPLSASYSINKTGENTINKRTQHY